MAKLKWLSAVIIKKGVLIFLFSMIHPDARSQVGIGTGTPNPSAQLEIATGAEDFKGILIPRVPLADATDAKTIAHGNVESLLVYNTAATTTVNPGYYYWSNSKWNRLITAGDIGDLVESQWDRKGVPLLPGSAIPGAPRNRTILLNNGDGTWLYDSAEKKWTLISKKTINYSHSEQETGHLWIDGSKVWWRTIEINNQREASEEFDLSGVFRPNEIAAVLSARVINKSSNGISTALLSYDSKSNRLMMGNGIVMPTPHSAGVHYIILEYVKTN